MEAFPYDVCKWCGLTYGEHRDENPGRRALGSCHNLKAMFELIPETVNLRAAVADQRRLMARVVAMSDRYCMHDMTIDESDLQNEIELLRRWLEANPVTGEEP